MTPRRYATVAVLASTFAMVHVHPAPARPSLGKWTGKLTAPDIEAQHVRLEVNRLKVGRRAGYLTYDDSGCVGALTLVRRTKQSFTFRYRELALAFGCVWDDEIYVSRHGRRLYMRVAAPDLGAVLRGLLRRCACDPIF